MGLWQFEFTLKPPSVRLGMLSHRGGRKGVNGCAAAPQPPKLSRTFSDGEAGAVFSPMGQNHPSLVSLSFQNVWVQHCQVKSCYKKTNPGASKSIYRLWFS